MTMILACHHWKRILVVADCRVSYGPHPQWASVHDDGLQKIYQIGDKLVVGFCGPVPGAAAIISHIQERYREQRSIADSARKQRARVEGWIREEYQRLRKEHRMDLGFILATVNPNIIRKSQTIHQDGTIGPAPSWWRDVPELTKITLTPREQGSKELIRNEGDWILSLGLPESVHEQVRMVNQELFGFGFDLKDSESLHTTALTQSLMFRIHELGQNTVGGYFQAVSLGREGIQWHEGYNFSGHGIEMRAGRYIMFDKQSGVERPLLTTQEWTNAYLKPGSLGVFEDPALDEIDQNREPN